LRGEVQAEQAIQTSTIPGVDVLGAKEGTSGAAELASSINFEVALRSVRERYEFILIDSAPVNQVSESALVARQADAALLVIRNGQTGRGGVLAAKRRLEGMGVRIMGGILNCASPRGGMYGYGYGYGYYSKYSNNS
jgi:Mrp family chromosome partitioning ATPase